jgi:uncharacterized protein YecE (DUF72 family)
MATILVGTAGWSYDDWRGRVYPERAPAGFDPLALLAAHFDLVEINVTFYRLPRPDVVTGWLRRLKDEPRFQFLLKAPRDWTHSRPGEAPGPAAPFAALARELAAAGRLGAVLLQFPWSLREGAAARARIAALRERLPEMPVAVEVRHASFAGEDWPKWLRRHDCLPVNVDQPALPACLALGADCGKRAAYFRLHGRNAASWFADTGRDARYDYLYGPAELESIAARVEEAAARVPLLFLVTNNHFRGQAAVNALQLRARLLGRPVPVPPQLLASYPALAAVAAALPPRAQGELF